MQTYKLGCSDKCQSTIQECPKMTRPRELNQAWYIQGPVYRGQKDAQSTAATVAVEPSHAMLPWRVEPSHEQNLCCHV